MEGRGEGEVGAEECVRESCPGKEKGQKELEEKYV